MRLKYYFQAGMTSSAIKSRLGIQEKKVQVAPAAPPQPQNVGGPPGLARADHVLSFGSSPVDAGR